MCAAEISGDVQGTKKTLKYDCASICISCPPLISLFLVEGFLPPELPPNVLIGDKTYFKITLRWRFQALLTSAKCIK